MRRLATHPATATITVCAAVLALTPLTNAALEPIPLDHPVITPIHETMTISENLLQTLLGGTNNDLPIPVNLA